MYIQFIVEQNQHNDRREASTPQPMSIPEGHLATEPTWICFGGAIPTFHRRGWDCNVFPSVNTLVVSIEAITKPRFKVAERVDTHLRTDRLQLRLAYHRDLNHLN